MQSKKAGGAQFYQSVWDCITFEVSTDGEVEPKRVLSQSPGVQGITNDQFWLAFSSLCCFLLTDGVKSAGAD
jgi:hypothetical protein